MAVLVIPPTLRPWRPTLRDEDPHAGMKIFNASSIQEIDSAFADLAREHARSNFMWRRYIF